MESFDFIHHNFAFGMMRLPMNGEEVDEEQVKKMADYFIDHGFNYFDTAHGYINGLSEKAVKHCLTSRYDRSQYVLTDKLTGTYFNCEADIRPFFESQLEITGAEYFDFYLMHAQNARDFKKFKACRAYETAFELKKEGRVKHVGISFHDTPEVLDQILTEYPEVEIVQIQLNYLDYDNPSVQSYEVYKVCEKHDKPVLVMEPVKGGSLVNLPDEAKAVFNALNAEASYASYAMRYAAGFKNVRVVLSGMSNMEQMMDNVKTMESFVPLNEEEQKAIEKVREIFTSKKVIPCTACHYCVEENHCPKGIRIPEVFQAYNSAKIYGGWNAGNMYTYDLTGNGHGKASECLSCGACERVCPQHLPIRDYLKEVAKEFEK